MRGGRGELRAASAMAAELATSADPVATGVSELVAAIVDIEQGRPAEARTRLEPLLEVVRGIGVDLFLAPVAFAVARVELTQSRPEVALALLDEADRSIWSPLHEHRPDVLLLRGRAGWLRAEGTPAGSVDPATAGAATAADDWPDT